MTTTLNPYLHLEGTAGEALTFYQSVLGGELSVMTYGDMGTEGDLASSVMHGQLTTPEGHVLMASDVPPGMPFDPGTSVRVSLSGDDEARLTGWFHGLADGGEVQVPLERQMWGDVFGQCRDRFGVIWLVNIAGDAVAGATS